VTILQTEVVPCHMRLTTDDGLEVLHKKRSPPLLPKRKAPFAAPCLHPFRSEGNGAAFLERRSEAVRSRAAGIMWLDEPARNHRPAAQQVQPGL
jgi:hypothetical protein